ERAATMILSKLDGTSRFRESGRQPGIRLIDRALRRRHAWSCRRGVFAHGGFFHRSTPCSHQSDTPGNLYGSGSVKDAGTLVVPDTFGENGHTDHGLNLTVLPDRQLLVKRSVEPP